MTNAVSQDASPDGCLRADMRRRDAMRVMADRLKAAGVDDPALDAKLLFCAAAEIDSLDLIRDPDAPLGDYACERLELSLRRRLAREPVSRILGMRGFWSLDLAITADVLDPRADSETLIDAALELFADRQQEALRIADLGVGSGALLCALLDIFSQARGVAVDISPRACDVARTNLHRCGALGRASVLQGEWAAVRPGPYDIIVSNPPYIATGEIAGLDPEVRDHDPRLALDGGPDGLEAYRRIVPLLPEILAPGGLAILEIGYRQGEDVQRLIDENGLRFSGLRYDLGGNPRAILAMAREKIDPASQNSHILAS